MIRSNNLLMAIYFLKIKNSLAASIVLSVRPIILLVRRELLVIFHVVEKRRYLIHIIRLIKRGHVVPLRQMPPLLNAAIPIDLGGILREIRLRWPLRGIVLPIPGAVELIILTTIVVLLPARVELMLHLVWLRGSESALRASISTLPITLRVLLLLWLLELIRLHLPLFCYFL